MTELQEKLSRLSPEKRRLLALRLALDSSGVKTADAPQASIPVDPANRQQPFPLTDLQQAYWIGRGGAFDINVASHSYLELEGVSLDLDRMNQAWQRVIDRHEMLRAIIHPHGEQQVLDQAPRYEIAVSDLRGKDSSTVAAKLDELRNELSHQVLDADHWPLFDIRACRLDGGRVRIFVSLDALFIDGWSIHLLLTEWSRFYSEREWSPEPITLSFRDWVLAENEATKSEAFKQARAYWQQRVPSLPPAPSLPLACNPATLKKARFVRQIRELPAEQWQQLKTRAAQAGLTPTGVLVSAYAEVLSLWSGSRRFTINLPRFNRPPLHPESNKLVAEIASFTLLEIDNSGEESFEIRAKRHQGQLWQDLSNGAFGGVKVLREIAQTQSRYSEALMPVIFTSLPENTRISELPGLGNVIYRINQTSQVWLDNHVTEHDGALHIDWDSVEGLLPAGMSEDMLDAYMRLLESLADEEQTWQQTWTSLTQQLLPAAQLARRKELNSIEASLPDCLLTDLFAEQVVQRPEQQAVVAADCSLSYAELHQLSLRWGRKLRECGVKPNHLVAVVMEKGWEQVVAVLGIDQAGGAYLPIDASVPQQRLSYLLENSGAEIVLTQSNVDQRFEWPDGIKRFAVDREDLKQYEATPLDRAQGPDDLAYVLYTSGSTGQPKGVMISQRGAVNCVLRTNQRFDLGPDARALGLTALHHDMSVYDIFGILSVGGTLIVPEEARRRDPAHWLELMSREGVTFWCSVPATMEMLLEYATTHPHGLPESLRLVFLGGDWIPVSLPQRLKAAFPAAKLVSVGGPTETTMWNIWYPVEKVDPNWKTIPYGKPIANNKYYVLNEALGDCPDWVSGEQYVGGVQLARGYWRDEQKTAERFITHPRTGERLYRTGDRGRYLPDGNIEFLGRADFQVKINGQRIELGEIESALSGHPAVKAAIVSVAGRDSTKKRLVGYVVSKNGNAPAAEELATFLRGKLPEHMVPTAFVTLECLPLTANGKVERQRLPEPAEPVEAVAGPAAKSAALSGPKTTAVIAGMVADVLGIPTPEAQANLLTLGANSLDMVRLGNSLEKKFGLRPRMDQLFRMQTVAALAEYYDEHLGQKMSAQAVGPRADDDVAAMIASYEVMIDPSAREKFKESMPGVRRDNGEESTALRQPPLTEELLNEYRNRRTSRQFSLKAVPLDALSEWLSCLRPTTIAGKRKYLYASPGGLYPTQVYLHCKPGRVESLDAGVYYYNPVEHKLVLLTPRVEIDRGIHIPFINTPVFDEAGFSVFLICEFAALAPSYGERSMHFATMEAGILTHLLETHAHAHEIALCSIGTIDFDRIRPWFRLGKSQVLIHSMVGGRSNAESTEPAAKPWDRVSTLEDRIKKLSPEEVTALLKAHKRGASER